MVERTPQDFFNLQLFVEDNYKSQPHEWLVENAEDLYYVVNKCDVGDVLAQDILECPSFLLKEALAMNIDTPLSVLKKLAETNKINVLREIGRNPNCDDNLVGELIPKLDRSGLGWMAQSLPPKKERFVVDIFEENKKRDGDICSSDLVFLCAAKNETASKQMLETTWECLRGAPDVPNKSVCEIASKLLEHENISDGMEMELSRFLKQEKMQEMKKVKKANKEELVELADSFFAEVRLEVAKHKNADTDVWIRLADDRYLKVKEVAQKKLNERK